MPELPHYKNLPDRHCSTCLYRVYKTINNKKEYRFLDFCLLDPHRELKLCEQYKLGRCITLSAYLGIPLEEVFAEEKNSDRKALYNLAPEILQRAFNYEGD